MNTVFDPHRLHRAGPFCLVLLCSLLAGIALGAGPVTDVSDESFIRQLEESGADHRVDRQRLSRLLFGISATLEGGESSVRLLGSVIRVREPARENANSAVAVRYSDYRVALDELAVSAARLLDRQDSGAALYHVLADGHRACWQLDAFTRTVENYGVRSQDLMSILSSIEACARFRRVAHLPPVETIISRELEETDRLRDEARSLREELDEIERLLDDLRRLDAAD